MPLLHSRLLNEHTLLGMWHITEQPEELFAALPAQLCTEAISGNIHPKRQLEWLASRTLVYALLPHFTSEPLCLLRDENGKPFFENSTLQVSITHTPELAAVIISNKYHVGIDIERINPKALRVAGKFLSEAEQTHTAGEELKTCLYWSAKETLYKLYSKRKLLFKENILLRPDQNFLSGSVQTNGFSRDYRIYHELIRNHVLTYCYDQNYETSF